MTKEKGDVLQGTLDMLVLKALQLEPMHGWGITERIFHGFPERAMHTCRDVLYDVKFSV